ncbi:hypothetical protein [Lacunimicrobium album]
MIAPTIPSQPSGEDLKKKALKLLGRTRFKLIRKAKRLFLESLLAQGKGTIDDARMHLEIPDGIDPRFMGSVPTDFANDRVISRVGLVPSVRPATHASHRSVWQLIDRQAAQKWLQDHPEIVDVEDGTTEAGGNNNG